VWSRCLGLFLPIVAKNAAATDTWLVRGVKRVDNLLIVRYPVTVAALTDAEITSAIRYALLYDPDIFPHKIEVAVNSGWVTLKGAVDANWKKQQAEDDAFSVRGVLGIKDELAVVPTKKTADEEIAKRIVNALERNTNVSVNDVTVTVNNGNVTLKGSVPTSAAKHSAYDSAFYTYGVISVNDQMTVNW